MSSEERDLYEALESLVRWYGNRDENDNLCPSHEQPPEIRDAMDALANVDAKQG